jgi:tetratricopeptide (TPR) repeat protein
MRKISQYSVIVFLFVSLAACSKSPAEVKAHHRELGDNYLKHEKYKEALIEYKNVVQADPQDAEGHYKLAQVYLKIGGIDNLRNGFAELTQTVRLDPKKPDAQLKLGQLYLLSRNPKLARAQAEFTLGLEPNNAEGQALLGQAHILGNELDQGIAALRKALELDPKMIPIYIDLARAHLAKQDSAAAEETLKQAVTIEPKSWMAHIALGDFAGLQGKFPEAEAEYQKAIEVEPGNAALRLKLAKFYLAIQRPDRAEAILGDTTRLMPGEEIPILEVGDLYAVIGKTDLALGSYRLAEAKHPKSLLPRRKIAQLQLAIGQPGQAEKTIEAVVKDNPSDLESQFISAQVNLAQNKTKEAIEILKRVLKYEPKAPNAHFLLGVAFAQANDLPQARRELTEAVSIAPELIEPRLSLATLYHQDGSYDLAIEQVRTILRSQPKHTGALLVYGNALLGKKEWRNAREVYEQVTTLLPNLAVAHYKLGLVDLAQTRTSEAVSHFETALAKDPGLIEALSAIMSIHVTRGETQKALDRGLAQLEVAPDTPRIYNLLGRVSAIAHNDTQAEAYFAKSLELDKGLLISYVDLGQLYLRQNDPRKAIAKLELALAVNPALVEVQTMLGVVHEGLKEYEKAKGRYEQALRINPTFAPAANNLAILYADRGGDIDKALSLAQTAREQLPQDPLVADTLGWLYYKKNVNRYAVSLLKEAAVKASDNAIIQYHLGLAYHKSGDKELAKQALQVSLKLNPSHPGADEARKLLREL